MCVCLFWRLLVVKRAWSRDGDLYTANAVVFIIVDLACGRCILAACSTQPCDYLWLWASHIIFSSPHINMWVKRMRCVANKFLFELISLPWLGIYFYDQCNWTNDVVQYFYWHFIRLRVVHESWTNSLPLCRRIFVWATNPFSDHQLCTRSYRHFLVSFNWVCSFSRLRPWTLFLWHAQLVMIMFILSLCSAVSGNNCYIWKRRGRKNVLFIVRNAHIITYAEVPACDCAIMHNGVSTSLHWMSDDDLLRRNYDFDLGTIIWKQNPGILLSRRLSVEQKTQQVQHIHMPWRSHFGNGVCVANFNILSECKFSIRDQGCIHARSSALLCVNGNCEPVIRNSWIKPLEDSVFLLSYATNDKLNLYQFNKSN